MKGYFNAVEHYYGDRLRLSILIAAIVSFVALPLYGDVLHFGIAAQVLGGLILVLLAGLTNPHSKPVIIADVLATGIGAFLLEVTAITYYSIDSTALFFTREFEAILLMIAFYYSVKTARAMYLNIVGKIPGIQEFGDTKE
jgi:hypothetical protein